MTLNLCSLTRTVKITIHQHPTHPCISSCSGKITVDGAAGSMANSGGGSGGTVLVNAVDLKGHGLLSVNGGQGHGIGGGGSGGRMKIQLDSW